MLLNVWLERVQNMRVLQQDLEEAERQVDVMTERIESNKSEMSRLQRCEATNSDLHLTISNLRTEHQATADHLADAKFEMQQLQTDWQVGCVSRCMPQWHIPHILHIPQAARRMPSCLECALSWVWRVLSLSHFVSSCLGSALPPRDIAHSACDIANSACRVAACRLLFRLSCPECALCLAHVVVFLAHVVVFQTACCACPLRLAGQASNSFQHRRVLKGVVCVVETREGERR